MKRRLTKKATDQPDSITEVSQSTPKKISPAKDQPAKPKTSRSRPTARKAATVKEPDKPVRSPSRRRLPKKEVELPLERSAAITTAPTAPFREKTQPPG